MQFIGPDDGRIGAGTVIAGVHWDVPLTRYCTVYDKIGLPPSPDGVVHVKDTDRSPGSAVKPMGALGVPYGSAAMTEYGPW